MLRHDRPVAKSRICGVLGSFWSFSNPWLVIVVDIDIARHLDYVTKVNKYDHVKRGESTEPLDGEAAESLNGEVTESLNGEATKFLNEEATESLNGEEEAESEAEEEDYEFMCHYMYLNEILEGEEDQEEEQMSFDEAEVPEEISSEVKGIAREFIPFLVSTPDILVQPPKLSLHFSDFEKIEPPVKIQLFKGELELCKCSICLSKVSRGTIVAKLPCQHLVHRDCIYQKVPDLTECAACGLRCSTLI